MQCTTCDSWTSVCETRKGDHGTTKRVRLCANGHRFPTIEISAVTYTRARPAILRSMQTIAARVLLWKRNERIAKDPRAARLVTTLYSLTASEISKIRNRILKKSMALDKAPTNLTR